MCGCIILSDIMFSARIIATMETDHYQYGNQATSTHNTMFSIRRVETNHHYNKNQVYICS